MCSLDPRFSKEGQMWQRRVLYLRRAYLRRAVPKVAVIGSMYMMAACESTPPRARTAAIISITASRDTVSYATFTILDSIYLVASVADENGVPYDGDSVSWVSTRSSM